MVSINVIDQFLQTSGEEHVVKDSKHVVKGQKHVVKTSDKILAAMRANPEVTAEMLAADLELSQRGIEDSIARLRKSGRVLRHGGRKDGYWEVVELV